MRISIDKQIREICAKHERDGHWRLDPIVEKEIAALHGIEIGESDVVNDSGVFKKRKLLTFAKKDGHWGCRGEIRYCQTPKGHWLMSLDVSIHHSGSMSPISIWNREIYPTAEDAINDGVKILLEKCDYYLDPKCAWEEIGFKKRARELRNLIEAYQAQTKQLTLF